jgi:hypothetical protein
MKNLLILFTLTLLFSCEANLEKEKSNKNVTSENAEKEPEAEKKVEKEPENTIETEVSLVMQEYGYNGLGTYISPSGNKYVGEWKNGKKHGKGIGTYNDGEEIYEGDWENGTWNGQGTHTYAGGLNFYKGGFKNGRRHGKGFVSEMSEGGPIISKGTWTNGLWTIRE